MFEPKTYSDVLKRIAYRLVARSELTDLEEGGTAHTVAAAVAREVDDCYFQMTQLQNVWDIDTAAGDDLDERGKDLNPDEIERRLAAKATGSVVFARSGTTGTITVPVGTVVKVPSGGPQFETTAGGTIANGDTTSAAVAVQALEAGAAGNVVAGAISQMAAVSGVETVTNGAATTGGQDQETDAEYRARMKAYLRSLPRGTVDALKYAALSAEADGYGRVVTASVVEGEGPNLGTVWIYIDDGNGTVTHTESTGGTPEVVVASAGGGETRLFLDNVPEVQGATVTVRRNAVALVEGTDYTLNYATGQITLDATAFPSGLTALDTLDAEYTWYVGLIEEAQRIVNGDPSDRTSYPGYRAAGTRVYVLSPTVLQQTVRATVVVEDGYDGADVREGVQQAIERYINGLGINGDVILSELVHAAQSVAGVYDVVVTTPAGNVAIGEAELARVTTGNIELV